MSRSRASNAPTPPTLRSAVTNGKVLLPGIDGRSIPARRYRDLIEAFSEPLGGADVISDADKAMVRHVAALTIRSEQLQTAILLGEPVDDEELTRLTNAMTRMMATLRERVSPSVPAPSVADYLRNRGAAA